MNLQELHETMLQTQRQEETNSNSSHEIVSTTGYLLGINKEFFLTKEQNPNRALFIEIFDKLEKNRHAKILRNLSILRTSIEISFKYINNTMHQNAYELESFDYIPKDSLKYIRDQKVHIPTCKRAVDYIIELNKLIQDRINNCHSMYPSWVEWKYVKDLFIMPDGLKEEGTKAAASFYYPNRTQFPYGVYANVRLRGEGNILYNDEKFLEIIYSWHGDTFVSHGHVNVLNDDTKEKIYDFLDQSERIVIVVDCENADPFRFHAALEYLGKDSLSAVEKILLFNDAHTSIAWNDIGKELDIPVIQIQTERVIGHKSLVDHTLISVTNRECYRNNVSAFILVSSDSDFSALIYTMKEDARFLVMMEREHCSPHLKERLNELNTTFCFIEDFPYEESDEMKEQTILRELKYALMQNFDFNLDDLLNEIVRKTRADLSSATLKAIRKNVANNLRIEVEENGDLKIELNKKK